MKLKALIATLFVAGLAVSVAIAAPPPGKGHRKGERDGVAASSTTDSTSTSTSDSTSTSTEEQKGKGRGRGKQSGTACRPTVSFVLKGEFVSATVATDGSGSFALLVKRANKHGRALVGKQVTVETGPFTKMKRRGHASLGQLAAGDRVVAQVRACKVGGDATAASAKLYASRVVAHPKRSGDDEEESASETTTGTTTTDSTTTSTTESTTTATTTSP